MSFRSFAKRCANKQDEKFGNKRTLCALGHSHRSKLESAVCAILQLRAKAGELEILQVEDHVYLTEARIGYIPDFKCMDLRTRETFHVESKGFPNDRWPIIKKLWRVFGPDRLEIWCGTHSRPFLDEIIIPSGGKK